MSLEPELFWFYAVRAAFRTLDLWLGNPWTCILMFATGLILGLLAGHRLPANERNPANDISS